MSEIRPMQQPIMSTSTETHSTMNADAIAKAVQRHNRKHAGQSHPEAEAKTCASQPSGKK